MMHLIKELYLKDHPYGEWLKRQKMYLTDYVPKTYKVA
jgi:hypothetical protein